MQWVVVPYTLGSIANEVSRNRTRNASCCWPKSSPYLFFMLQSIYDAEHSVPVSGPKPWDMREVTRSMSQDFILSDLRPSLGTNSPCQLLNWMGACIPFPQRSFLGPCEKELLTLFRRHMSSTVPLLLLRADRGPESAAPACGNEENWPVRESHAEDGREGGERTVGEAG